MSLPPLNWYENLLTALKGLQRRFVILTNLVKPFDPSQYSWYELFTKRGGPTNPGAASADPVPSVGEWFSLNGLPDRNVYTWYELLGLPTGVPNTNYTWMELFTKKGGLALGDLTFWEKFDFNYTLEGAGTPDTPYDFMKRATESIETGGNADTRLLDIFNAISLVNLTLGSLDATMTGIATDIDRIATATESIATSQASIDAKTP